MTDEAQRFDLEGQRFKRDPMPTFAAMRTAGPVIRARVPILGDVSFETGHFARALPLAATARICALA